MESASWQRPLYGFKINQNQAEIPLKTGVLGRSGGVNKLIKKRFNDDIIKKLLEIRWWDYPIDIIKNCIHLIAIEPTVSLLDETDMKLK